LTNRESWTARDGYPLAVSIFEPDTEAVATVLIAGATAVPARLYHRFARYLRARNLRVICFDYRGVGASLHGDVRSVDARMRDWGELDLAGMIDGIGRRYPSAALVLVGHSAGGQLVALADNNERIAALLLVAAQSGYWRHWPRPRRYLLWTLWYALMPGLTRSRGYFPAQLLQLGENLPAGVAMEWSRWCRHPRYFVGDRGEPLHLHLAGFEQPVVSYSIEDDWMAPAEAVDALFERFAGAQGERRHIRPADYGLDRIGHFGFFREPGQGRLWAEALSWIESNLP